MTVKRKVNNVTSVTLVNATAKTLDLSPGTDVRWTFLSCRMVNPDDVGRNSCSIQQYEAGATVRLLILQTTNLGAGGDMQQPNRANTSIDIAGHINENIIIDGTEIMRFVWPSGGASTGATDADGLVMQCLEEAL